MNLYTGNPDSDDSCVASDLEKRYRMFLAEGFSPGEAAREAKEIIKFEWLVDQGRDQDQAALLVQMPLRSMMMTTFSQRLADLGYPVRIQWLMDRGLYTFEEATVLAFHPFDVLVVMHDEEEVAAGRQHRIQDYFACNRHRRLRSAGIHPLASGKGERAKVAAVKPTFRTKETTLSRSVPPVAGPSSSDIFTNLDRYLSAPDPIPEEESPAVPEIPAEPKPTISNIKHEPVVAKRAKITPTEKPSFKWSWKSPRANANLSTVASAFGPEAEEEAFATLTKTVVPEVPETQSTEEDPQPKPVVPEIPKTFNVPPPPLPIPPPTGSTASDPALLAKPIFPWARPVAPVVIPEPTPEPPPLPAEVPKPPEPEPEPVFQISTITTGPTTKPAEVVPQSSKYSWVNPALGEKPRPIPSLAAPQPIPSLAAIPSTSAPPLKWSSPQPQTEQLAPSGDEFSLNWDKAWGEAVAAPPSSSQQGGRWANFELAADVEEDPDDPYGVKLLNRRSAETVAQRSASPANKVDDLYAMMNRFQ